MRRMRWVLAAAGMAACATAPAPEPASLDHGLLIARARAYGAVIRGLTKDADSAIIVALDAAGTPVPGKIAQSRFSSNGYVVFFGMPAGRYVLREATFRARGVRYELLVPQPGESKRAVLLRPGKAAYLGDYGFDSRLPDFYVGIARAVRIAFHWLTPFLSRPLLPREADMHGFHAGPEDEIPALHAVRGALAGTQWRRVVDARLRELGAADPPKLDGGLVAKELPLHEEPIASWRDTLRWGEPRRVPGGLGWSRPGGEAQVALFFTSVAAPGFSGWNAAVSDLRRSAASSVEDAGGVYEVRVATRAGLAARSTRYRYPEGLLVGSETAVVLTETILVPDGSGLFTARLRAPRGEFEAALPAYREFLLQLVLGPPPPRAGRKTEAALPFAGSQP